MDTSPDLPKAPPGYRLQWDDTPYHVEKLLFDHWRTLTPREKAELGGQACQGLHEGLKSGVRARHPNASDDELELRVAFLKYGEELMHRVTGLELPKP
ncbi:MAG: hypothetical protein K8S98_13315 [Planctomycetes bacterium]|nr:hypothetical protein [Planctomycetota bacterium]